MGEQAADVPPAEVGQARVARLVVEQRLAALPQRLVDVHARAVVLEHRLGHERRGLAVLVGDVLHDVLVEHQLVGHAGQLVEAHVDLGLACGADLVVLDLDLDAHLLEGEHHLGPQVLEVVGRREGEVALLVADLVAEVGLLVAGGVPGALDRVDAVARRVVVLVVAHVVEDEELGLGADVAGVGDAGRPQVLGRLARHVAGIAAVGLAGERVVDEAVDRQRLPGAEGVDERGVGVGDQDHVRLLDLLEPADRRAVEAHALVEQLGRELAGRHREVLHQARQIAEADVDDLDVLVGDEAEHLVGCALVHGGSSGSKLVSTLTTAITPKWGEHAEGRLRRGALPWFPQRNPYRCGSVTPRRRRRRSC